MKKLLLNKKVIIDTNTIGELTKKSYISKINNLGKIDLLKIRSVRIKITKLSKGNPNTEGNYYSAIMKFLELTNNLDLRNEYKIFLKRNIKKHDNKPKKKSEKIKKIDYPKKSDNYIKFLEKNVKKLTLGEFLLSFYILLPPRRREYQNMIYTEKSPNEEDNFLYYDGKSYNLHFNNFKNSKKLNIHQKFKIINKLLIKIIKNRKLKEGQKLFDKSPRSFLREIHKTTLKHFDKKLGTNDLRVLYNSSKFKNININELKEDADKMGHSVFAKINNYIRE